MIIEGSEGSVENLDGAYGSIGGKGKVLGNSLRARFERVG